MKKSKTFIIGVIASIVSVSVVLAFWFNYKTYELKHKENIVYVDTNEERLENFTKKDAFNEAQAILQLAVKDIEGKDRTPDDRIAEIVKTGKASSGVSQDMLDKLYIDEEWGDIQENESITAIGLIVQATVVSEMTGDEEFAAALSPEKDGIIYLDSTNGTAYVRMDVFTGLQTGLYMQMEYMDGEWKLAPYSMVNSMLLTDMLTTQE